MCSLFTGHSRVWSPSTRYGRVRAANIIVNEYRDILNISMDIDIYASECQDIFKICRYRIHRYGCGCSNSQELHRYILKQEGTSRVHTHMHVHQKITDQQTHNAHILTRTHTHTHLHTHASTHTHKHMNTNTYTHKIPQTSRKQEHTAACTYVRKHA